LVGRAGDVAVEAQRSAIALHEQALTAAFEGRFADALALLGDVDVTGDTATKLLATRCRAWLVSPPPAGWDGTWTATTK
jgi:adenylate cyclase